MNIQPLDIAIHVVNVVVLYVLLRSILYNPVQKYLKQRSDAIASEVKGAEDARADAEKLRTELAAQLKGADQVVQQKLIEGARQAGEQASELIEGAKIQAQTILEKAQMQAQKQHQETVSRFGPQISEMALSLAEQILKREVSAKDNEKVIEAFYAKEVDRP